MEKTRREEWGEHVRRQRMSGKPVAGYCRENGLGRTVFFRWRKKLAEEGTGKAKGFERIGEEEKSVKIKTPAGYELEVRSGMDGNLLREVLGTLAKL